MFGTLLRTKSNLYLYLFTSFGRLYWHGVEEKFIASYMYGVTVEIYVLKLVDCKYNLLTVIIVIIVID